MHFLLCGHKREPLVHSCGLRNVLFVHQKCEQRTVRKSNPDYAYFFQKFKNSSSDSALLKFFKLNDFEKSVILE